MKSTRHRALSHYKILKIFNCFKEDMTASMTSRELGINRNTINSYYTKWRFKIQEHQAKHLDTFKDKKPFCSPRYKQDGRHKIIILGMFYDDLAFTQILDESKKTMLEIKFKKDSMLSYKFWDYVGERLRHLGGVGKNIDLHLKECEFRFNKQNFHDIF